MSNPNVLQVLVANGAILHTLLNASGTWQGFFGNVNGVNGNSDLQFSQVGGTGVGGTLHVCGVASDGGLYHTYRSANGGWQGFLGDVNSENTGASVPAFTDVGCAGVQSNGLVHVCAVGTDGILYHTYRNADGSWQGFYGNVNSENGDNTPSFSRVSCTTMNDTLYVFGLDNSGGRWGNVWYTYRNADGSWQGSFTSLNSFGPCLDVSCTIIDTILHACAVSNYTGYITHASSDNWQSVDTAPSYDPSSSARFYSVSCTNVAGNLHVAGQANSSDLHIVRDASGNWLIPYDNPGTENGNGPTSSVPLALASTTF